MKNTLNYGKGTKTFWLIAEGVNMGMSFVDIKLTDNKVYAESQIVIAKIKADSKEEAKELFKVRNMIG